MNKIEKIKIEIEFSDGSSTFEHFTKAEGAKDWMEAWENEIAKEENLILGSQGEPDAYMEKESERGIM